MPDETSKKPHIFWLEGLLDLFNAPFPHKKDDPRRLGFSVGQQILGLYIIEMLLKYASDDTGVKHGQHHNLHELFRNLPRQKRRAVERKYTEILNSNTQWTWDVAKSADSFLWYLGKNAITDTRYFWEQDRTHIADHASILIMPDKIRNLVYALFITLHNYPSKPIRKRYNTTFESLADSLKRDKSETDAELPSAVT